MVGQLPDTKALHKQLGSKGLEIMGVSLDETRDDAKRAAKRLDLPWRNLWNGSDRAGPLTGPFRVNGIPDCVLIDATGRVRAIGVRPLELEDRVRKLLAERSLPGGK